MGDGIKIIDFQRLVASPALVGCEKLSFNISNEVVIDSTKMIDVMISKMLLTKTSDPYSANSVNNAVNVITHKSPYRFLIQKIKLKTNTAINIINTYI